MSGRSVTDCAASRAERLVVALAKSLVGFRGRGIGLAIQRTVRCLELARWRRGKATRQSESAPERCSKSARPHSSSIPKTMQQR